MLYESHLISEPDLPAYAMEYDLILIYPLIQWNMI